MALDGLTILYLENETLVALDTSTHLETLGFEAVHVAHRLAAAEGIAEDNTLDLAVLDINVDKGQTSIALGHKLAQAGTRVIFASGNVDEAETLRAQGFEFLDKPFSLAALTNVIKGS